MKYYLKVLKNYINFNGRARRREFWYFTLIDTFIFAILSGKGYESNYEALAVIYLFVTIVPAIAVSIRRMHDVNKSGWYILIPLYGFILLFVEGDTGRNQYGEDPKLEVL